MLFDIGAGILLGLWLGPNHSTFANVAFGILFTLLPDIDVFLYLSLRKIIEKRFGKSLQDHRVFLHYPLPFLAIGGLIILLAHSSLFPLFIAGTLEQFLHDSVGPGWGIPWLFPFSKKYFKFFYQLDLAIAAQPQKFMWIWGAKEQEELAVKYGDADWHKHLLYFAKAAPTWNLFELSVFIVGLVVLALH